MRTAAIGLLIIVFVAGYHGQVERAQADKIERASEYSPPKATPAIGDIASAKRERRPYQKGLDYLKRAFRPEFLASWALFLAAGFGLLATFLTLGILKAQTRAANQSASAAFLSATAITSIERAWLLPDGFVDPPNLPTVRMSPIQEEQFSVNIKNFGRTPAFLVEWLCKVLVTDNASSAGDLDYRNVNSDTHGIPFPPDKCQNFFATWRIEDPQEIDMIERGKKHLYIYGFVKYLDAFRDTNTHQTYFCFHYSRERDSRRTLLPIWSVEPAEANRNT